MIDFGSFGSSLLRAFGGGASRHAARVGLALAPEYTTLVRVQSQGTGLSPRIECAQRVAVESSHRTDLLRRWLHTGRLRDAAAVVLLAPGEYDLLQVAAPAVPDDELREALRWQLREQLAYPPEEAALDFVRIPSAADARPRASLLVVAAPKATVANAVAPLLELGLPVEAVDIPEFAQRNLAAISTGAPDPRASTAWLGFESNACLLTVHVGEELAFARRIPVHGLNQEDFGSENLVAYLSDRVATQVQRTLDLHERQSGHAPVTRITLSPHRYAEALAGELARSGTLTTRVFAPVAAPGNGDTPGAEAWTQDHICALGGALRGATTGATRPSPLPGWFASRRPATTAATA